jgi:hypothetical protein
MDPGRRAFLGKTARNAAYVAPVMLMMTKQARAQVSCLPNNSPCVVNEDCCSLNCTTIMMGATMVCMN